jgi:uncharacterized caspase-like protein
MRIDRLAAFILLALGALAALAPSPAAAQGEARTALVIGNSQYAASPLANPVRDANSVAAALRDAGFEVILEIDADREKLSAAIDRFGRALDLRKGVALFYFAGHGVQIGGENYLIPVGATFRGEADLKSGSLRAADVTEVMNRARTSLNIVVLDACRDNGFGASQVRGLSRMDTSARLFVSFSTSPGAVALDGSGDNSPYTKYLADAIKTPGIPLEEAFKRTLRGVYVETAGRQTPWISSSFFGDFIFRPGAGGAASPAQPAAPERQAALRIPSSPTGSIGRGGDNNALPSLTGIYRASGTNPDGSAYRGMVAVTQEGDQFSFKWWIGRQTFLGDGHFAGRMLVVNWGDKHPVIYNFGPAGALDGEWADGSAKESLTPHALASTAGRPIEGNYRVEGRTAKGGAYSGNVVISRRGDRYRVNWSIGSDHYQGEGHLEGNLLTVDWNSATPVVYALTEDGALRGLWDAGAGQEILTRE